MLAIRDVLDEINTVQAKTAWVAKRLTAAWHGGYYQGRYYEEIAICGSTGITLR